MFWLALVVILTIGFSFICSIWEAALYSVPPGRVENLRQGGSSRGIRLAILREKMDRPVSAILTLNTIAHTAGATVAGSLVQVHYGSEYLTAFSTAFVFAILVFSEIIPKTLGFTYANFLAPLFAWPVQILVWSLYPAVILSEWIARLLRPAEKDPFPTEDDILSVAHLGEKEGEILPEELKWLENVLHLNNVKAKDIMTPREKIQHFDIDMKLEQIRETVDRWSHARMILTRGGDPDDIAGIVLRHEVIGAICEENEELKLSDLARPVNVVAPTARGHKLLKDMIRLHQHMFIVADKSKKTLGLVTLEDLIEEMLGEEIENEPTPLPKPRGLLRRKKEK